MTLLLIPRTRWASAFDYAARHRQQFRAADPAKVETVLHTTVTIAPDLLPPYDDEHEAMRTLERIGTQRFRSGVSYNAAVMPSGRAYEGQPLDNKSTHSEYGDWNYTRASIAWVGNYERDRPTEEMIRTTARIQAAWLRQGVIGTVALRGHYEVAPKACPGRYAIARMDAIAAQARALLDTPEDDVTLDELVKALKDDEHPLSRQLRRHVREAVQDELLQERRGENPPT